MLFQPILIGSVPYVVTLRKNAAPFPVHFHHEIELVYCLSGRFCVEVNSQKFTVSAGQLLYIGATQAHAYLSGDEHEQLLIELGPLLMQDHFARLASCRLDSPVIDCQTDAVMRRLCEDTAALCRRQCADADADELEIVGNIYKISAWLLRYAEKQSDATPLRHIPRIERALALVHRRYNEPLTVEDAAKETGYGKSNFCKLFRKAVGTSFHAYLNAFRVRNAGYLLMSTSDSIEEIGARVGFSDAKTFCRVFRDMTGTTPGKYRAGKTS